MFVPSLVAGTGRYVLFVLQLTLQVQAGREEQSTPTDEKRSVPPIESNRLLDLSDALRPSLGSVCGRWVSQASVRRERESL